MDGAALYDALWRNALGVIPLVIAIAILCRLVPLRAATRHTLWMVALLSLFIPPVFPQLNLDRWFAERDAKTVAKSAHSTEKRPQPVEAEPISPKPLALMTPSRTSERSASERSAGVSAPSRTTRPSHEPDLSGFKSARELQGEDRTDSVSRLASGAPESPRISQTQPPKAHSASRPVTTSPAESAPVSSRAKSLPTPLPPVEWDVDPTAMSKSTSLGLNRPVSTSPLDVVSTATTPLVTLARSLVAPLFERDTYALWVAEARAVRDVIVALPPIPVAIWIGGAGIIAIIATLRIALHRRLLSRALPASVRVQMMVDDSADAFGLRRSPTTYMVMDRVSPMIWCGVSPKLILPIELWRELDDAGRRAVVHHELAHLKRRDHWLRWAELVVGCVYWWHPMVWWVRRKLREEADNCCDAWVTALLPTERRAYATALLRTKAYLNQTTTTPGPVGLGVTTATAKRFARRLTMVMTHRTKPHLSLTGLLLAATLALAASIATPIWACPPDHHDKSPEEHAKMHAPKADKASKSQKAPKAAKAPKAGDADSTFEQFMQNRDQAPKGDTELDARLRELEKRLNRAMQNVEGLLGAPDAPTPPKAPAPPSPPSAAAAPLAALQYAQSADHLVDRSYQLPKDKLQRLTKLMSRDDVPILIIPGDDKITVRATEANHKVFSAFVSMIHPTPGSDHFTLSEGKLHDLSDLMILGSVPIRVRPSDDKITVYGSDLERRIFAAFAKMIDPKGFGSTKNSSKDSAEHDHEHDAAPAPAMRRGIEAEAHAAMNKARALTVEADRLEALRAEIEAKVEAIEAEAEEIEHKADAVAEEAEAMLERAEEIAAKAEESEATDARYRLVAEAGSLRAEAEARRVSAQALMAQAEAVFHQAAVLEAQAEAMEHRADALRDQADEIEDAIAEQLDSLEASLQDRIEKLNELIRQQAAQIEQMIEAHESRIGQEIDGRLAQQLRQQLSVIDRAAEQSVVVRNASNN